MPVLPSSSAAARIKSNDVRALAHATSALRLQGHKLKDFDQILDTVGAADRCHRGSVRAGRLALTEHPRFGGVLGPTP